MRSFTVKTGRHAEMIDITDKVAAEVRDLGAGGGVVTVFTPHTTAAITINENADPSVRRDLLADLHRLAPAGASHYTHAEGNSDAHLKSSLFGASETIPLDGGRLALGTWQGIYFCEFDGPRSRTVHVVVTPEVAGS